MRLKEIETEHRNFKIMTSNIGKVMPNAPDFTNMRKTLKFLLDKYKENRNFTVETATAVLTNGGCIWLEDWAEDNYGTEESPHHHYPVEDMGEFICLLEEHEDEIINLIRFSLEDCKDEEAL
mgnify:CR=1 FL=1